MNNSNNFYTSNPNFPGSGIYSNNFITPNQQQAPTTFDFPVEQSYIENILRLNKGKKVDIYMTFTDSTEWRDKMFSGIIEESGRDHIILSDPKTGNWYLLLMIYVDYIKFHEKINYSQEFIPNQL